VGWSVSLEKKGEKEGRGREERNEKKNRLVTGWGGLRPGEGTPGLGETLTRRTPKEGMEQRTGNRKGNFWVDSHKKEEKDKEGKNSVKREGGRKSGFFRGVSL